MISSRNLDFVIGEAASDQVSRLGVKVHEGRHPLQIELFVDEQSSAAKFSGETGS